MGFTTEGLAKHVGELKNLVSKGWTGNMSVTTSKRGAFPGKFIGASKQIEAALARPFIVRDIYICPHQRLNKPKSIESLCKEISLKPQLYIPPSSGTTGVLAAWRHGGAIDNRF